VLVVMPWPNFRWMTTNDIKAIYAILRALPPVENQVMPDSKGPFESLSPFPLPAEYNEGEESRPLPPETLPVPIGPPGDMPVPDPGNAVRGAALLPLSYEKMPHFKHRTAEEQASFGRGSYLVNAAACNDCHTNKNGLFRILTPGADFLKIPV